MSETTDTTPRGRIAAWRAEHPGERLTAATLRTVLSLASLRDADLRGADLRGAYLRDANLRGADLRGAYLGDADLRGAYLRGAYLGDADLRDANLGDAYLRDANLRDAYLRDANLGGANLRGANLRGANLGGAYLRDANLGGLLMISGLPSGDLTLLPTVDGWRLKVGCWNGTTTELTELIASDDGWPEARGEEVTRRRPLLAAAITLAEAHIAAHPDTIERVQREAAEGKAERARLAEAVTA